MDYKKEFAKGAKWNALRTVFTTAAQLLGTVIVARFVEPAEYGLFGMVNVFLGLAYVFTDAGFSDVVIYKQENDEKKISSLYWTNVIIGLGLFIIMILLSPLAALYYREPRLVKLISLSGINFLILPLGQIFISLAKKDLHFKMTSIVDITSAMVLLLATYVLAVRGYQVYSLIYARIFQSITVAVLYSLLSRKRYKISFYIKYSEIREFIRYGMYQMGSRLTNYLRSNADYLIIGRYLGTQDLGIYTLAYQLIMVPIQKINPILTETSYPIFVKFKDDGERINSSYYKLLKIIATLTFPLIVGLFVVAPEFVNIFYGARWKSAVLIIRIYCVLSMIIALGNPIGCLLFPKGRFGLAFKWNLISAFITLSFNFIGVRWGVLGVTVSSTLYALIVMWPADFILRKIVAGMGFVEYFIKLKANFLMAFLMLGFLLISKLLLRLAVESTLVIFATVIISGILIYLILVSFFEPGLFKEVKTKFLRRLS